MALPHALDGLAALWTGPRAAIPLVHGHLRAQLLALELPSAVVEGLLPPGLELAPQRLCEAGTHPIVLILGRYRDVHVAVERRDSGELRWDECSVGVPWVRRTLGPRPRPGQLRDQPLAITLRQHVDHVVSAVGGLLWTADRQIGRLELDDSTATVRSLVRERPILHAHFAPAAARVPRALIEAFRLPWVSRQPTGELKRFSFQWQPDATQFRPLTAQVDAGPGLLEGLPTGALPTRWAIEVSGTWSLILPEDLPDPAEDLVHLRRAHKLTEVEALARQWAHEQPQVAELADFWHKLAGELVRGAEGHRIRDANRLGRMVTDWFNRCRDAADAWSRGWWPGQAWQLALDDLPAGGLGPLLHAAVGAELPRVAVDHVMAAHLDEFASDFRAMAAVAVRVAESVPRLSLWFAAAWPELVNLAPQSPEHRQDRADRIDGEVARRLDAEALGLD